MSATTTAPNAQNFQFARDAKRRISTTNTKFTSTAKYKATKTIKPRSTSTVPQTPPKPVSAATLPSKTVTCYAPPARTTTNSTGSAAFVRTTKSTSTPRHISLKQLSTMSPLKTTKSKPFPRNLTMIMHNLLNNSPTKHMNMTNPVMSSCSTKRIRQSPTISITAEMNPHSYFAINQCKSKLKIHTPPESNSNWTVFLVRTSFLSNQKTTSFALLKSEAIVTNPATANHFRTDPTKNRTVTANPLLNTYLSVLNVIFAMLNR